MKIKNATFSKCRTTYIPILTKVVQMTTGPVLELGAGPYSTPLLHWLCAEDRRYLLTYENYIDYFKFAKHFQSRNHRIRHTKDWSDIDTKTFWDVVLIDHMPDERRGEDAFRLKDTAKYIILHDSQDDVHHGYDKIYKYFKYRYDWKFSKPWTTVVSNFVDVSKCGFDLGFRELNKKKHEN